jgi:hypothetical protein
MFISGVKDTGDKLLTPLTNLSVVSLTPAINLCHGIFWIGGVVDTRDKFITGDKFISGVFNTAEK